MKTINQSFKIKALTISVRGALALMLAMPLMAIADDAANVEATKTEATKTEATKTEATKTEAPNAEAAALKLPSNYVEIGALNVTHDSVKFGEYNGLEDNRVYPVANFDVLGGNAYGDGDGTMRWEAKGINLGTSSRELGGTVSNQGQWNLGINYDELRHYMSDTFQTPLQGAMGGNNFTMPPAFGVINTNFLGPVSTGRRLQGAQILTNTQLGLFHTEEVYTDRKNTSFTAGYEFDQNWGVKLDYNHLNQSGAKPMSVATDAALAASGPGGSTWGVEKMLMFMNPTDYTTDTVNLDLNWKGDKGFLTVGYFGSFFRDGNNSVTFPNFYAAGGTLATQGATGTPYPIDTLSTMPSNEFHQLNLTGGYTLTPATKLAGGLSYGRNTQDQSYPFAMLQVTPGVPGATALPMGGGNPPQNSLNGVVVTTHADLKLTNQTSKDLALSAGFKYNERDNQTDSNTYNFIDLGGKNRTAVNTPMSNKKTQLELAGDYRFDPNNHLRLAYEYEGIRRWCDNSLANNTQGVAPAGYVYTDNSCTQVPKSNENKLAADYKLKVGEAVNFNAGYSYGQRNSDVNSTFYNPMQALNEGFENLGYLAFFQASRKEQLVKMGVNWQANEKLSLGLNGRYLYDNYNDSTLGVQNGDTWSTNLDAAYNYSENGVVTAFASMQKRYRTLDNGAGRFPITPDPNVWTNKLYDDDYTFGLNADQKGLMGGKLELTGALTYSLGKTHYTTGIPYLPQANTCGASNSLTCGSTPDIKNRMWNASITGNYQIDKASKVAVGYLFQKLQSNDYYYNFYQTGYTGTGNLPTNEQAQSYSVNVITATYTYNF